MTYKEVATMIESIGVPYSYYQFSKDTAKPCPFICFYYDSSNDFAADDTNYQRIRRLILELYTDNKDFTLEETVEGVLNSSGLVYSRSETYIDSEQMYMVVFTTEIVITEESQDGE
jgi:hypothetical protein